jgi:S1-C subfamily serine protease
MGRSSESIA